MKAYLLGIGICLALVAPLGAVETEIRLGAGLLFDPGRGGAGVAIDLGFGAQTPLALSPFLEFYKKGATTTLPFGANLLYKAPVAEGLAHLYLGAGAGAVRIGNGNSETGLLLDGVGGISVKAAESLGVYGEVKYFYSSKKILNLRLIDAAGAFFGLTFSP